MSKHITPANLLIAFLLLIGTLLLMKYIPEILTDLDNDWKKYVAEQRHLRAVAEYWRSHPA
jgi:hypothetical protein